MGHGRRRRASCSLVGSPVAQCRRRLERTGRDVHADADRACVRPHPRVHRHPRRGVRTDRQPQRRTRVRDHRRCAGLRARSQDRLALAGQAGRHRPAEDEGDQHGADGRPDRHDRRLLRHVERRLRLRRRPRGQAERRARRRLDNVFTKLDESRNHSCRRASCCPSGRRRPRRPSEPEPGLPPGAEPFRPQREGEADEHWERRHRRGYAGTRPRACAVVRRRGARRGRDWARRPRAEAAAQEIGGNTRGVGFDLAEPHTIAEPPRGVGDVDHLVLAAIERDTNSVREYDIAARCGWSR